MEEIKISIIVPVYNAAKTLDACLGNLIHQTLESIEIILVDDCSTDHSFNRLKECERQFPKKVKVLQTEQNRGPGGARNVGMAHARGNYIGFVDSDDMVDVTMFEKLYQASMNEKYDIVDCGFYYEEKDSCVVLTSDEAKGELNSKKRCELIAGMGYVYTKLFRRSLLIENRITFRENVILEDSDFLILTFLAAKNIWNVKEVLYVYKYYQTSQSHIEGEKYYRNASLAMKAIYDAAYTDKEFLEVKEAVECVILQLYASALVQCITTKEDNPDRSRQAYDLWKLKEEIVSGTYDTRIILDKIDRNNLVLMKKVDQVKGKVDHLSIKNNVEISVIIPCYNVEQYISRCVASLEAQTIDKELIEYIFVDDASSDGTVKKLNELQKQTSIHMKIVCCADNGRQGKARNIGLKHAIGSYIGYVDADDWVEPDMFLNLYKKAVQHDCDIVYCRHIRDNGKGPLTLEKCETGENDQIILIEDDEQRKSFILSNVMGVGVWDKLYRRELIERNHISFPEHLAYEDIYFGAMFYLYANKVYILEQKLYHYFVNESSTVLSENKDYQTDIFKVGQMKYQEYINRGVWDKFHDELVFDMLVTFYLAGVKVLFLRYKKVPYESFRKLCSLLIEWIPDYDLNPYIDHSLNEYYKLLLKLPRLEVSQDELQQMADIMRNLAIK